MAKNNNLQDFLTDIADAIREENGTTELINPQDFRSKITEIGDKLRNILQGTATEITPEMLTGITTLRPYAFYYYDTLNKITIPKGVVVISKSAFYGCKGLTSITIPNSVTSIGESAFNSCKSLTTVTIPKSLTNIGTYLFYSCDNLVSVIIEADITSIPTSMFYSCDNLTDIVIPNSVTRIENNAFAYCASLTNIIIPDNVEYIGTDVFVQTNLKNIVIPSSVQSLGARAFQNCKNLSSVTYEGQPPSIIATFSKSSNVKKYDFRNATSIPTLSSVTSLDHATGCKIIVPDALHDSWKAATNWSALTGVTWVKASEYTEE